MARQSGRPAQLGADDVIRFFDKDHFLRELAGNLGRGRAFVRTRREFELQAALDVQIEAPGIAWKVRAEAVVVFARDGFVALEFENFEQVVLPELDRLGRDAERAKTPNENTVVGPMPGFEGPAHRSREAMVVSSIPEPVEAELDAVLRIPVDRGTTLLEDPPLEVPDFSDGTQDLRLYEERAGRHPSSPDLDADDAHSTRDDTPLSSPTEQDTDSSHRAHSDRPDTPIHPGIDPGIDAVGLEIFDDKSSRFLRATAGGVIRLEDDADLLGVFLSQIRHGLLLTIDGPDGAVGETIRLKVALDRVVTADAQILARVGRLVTLAISDPTPFRELLAEKKDALIAQLESILGTVAPSRSPLAPPSAPRPPAPAMETNDPKTSAPGRQAPAPVSRQASAPVSRQAEQPPIPEAQVAAAGASAPAPPKLVGQVVRFERISDLAHELKANLTNGGLFVESSALPLRSKKQLTLAVGDIGLGVRFEGEVVFADAGRVGFMVMHAEDAIAKLEQIALSGELPVHEDEHSSMDLDQRSLKEAASSRHEMLEPFKGKLDAPLTMGRVLDLQFRRIDSETDLAETTLLQLIEFLVRKECRGVVDVESDEKRKLSVWLHEGSIAFVTLKPADENHALGRILISMKRLNEAALRQGLEQAKQTKKSLGRTLVTLGLIKKIDLSSALREQTRLVVHSAFGFKGGRFEWGPWREPPGEADLVLTKGANVLAHHLRHRYEELGSAELEVLFGKNMGHRVKPVDDLDRIAGPIALQPKELRFLQLQVDGTRTISDAVLGSPIGRLASLRLIGVMLSLGQLRFLDGQVHVHEGTGLVKEPTGFGRIKNELRERLSLLRGMNHFEILGVHWSAHHRNHKTAYEKIKREFDLKRSPLRDAPEDVRIIAKEINGLIDTAWTALSNPESRQNYRKQLFDKTERQYAADMLVKQGELALIRGDRVQAIEALETAAELDPSNRNRTLLTSAREGRR